MARTALKVSLNSARDDYGIPPAAVVDRGPSCRCPSQSRHGVISERRRFSPQEQAAIRFAIGLVQGKWKIGILCRLQEGSARLGDLRRLFPEASKKMLTQHLRQMEQDGIIVRTDLSGKVSHVEYSLSEPGGAAVSGLLNFLAGWSPRDPVWIDDPGGIQFSDSGKCNPGSGIHLKDSGHCLEWNLDTTEERGVAGKGRLSRNDSTTVLQRVSGR